jgi:GNAT superfamily N-acetyltransferase
VSVTAGRSRWRIRRARAGDEATVAALLDEAQALHARLHPDYFRAPNSTARSIDIDSRALVAEHGGEVGGVIVFRTVEAPRIAFVTPARRLLVEDLAVRPDRRRAGCARALLEAARTHARSIGARQVVLTLWDGNPAAERLYASLGFRRVSQVLGLDV